MRVPVFVGHSEAINIEFEKELSAPDAQAILREAPGIMLVDKREDGGYVTPIECGSANIHLCQPRPRGSDDRERPLAMVRLRQSAQGAALNAVQIAELLGRRHLEERKALPP